MNKETENTFSTGNLLKQLRKRKGVTQEELAKEISYGVRQIRRFERDETELTNEAIELLSRFYNIDLNSYLSIKKSFKHINSYKDYVRIRSIIESNNFTALEVEYNKISDNPDFHSGEPLLLSLYCRSLILARLNENYIQSNYTCFKALDVFGITDYITSLKTNILPEMVYPVLFLLGYNFDKLDEFDLSFELTHELYTHFNSFVFSNSAPLKSDMYHMKKYYIAAANNLAHLYFELKDYTKALKLVDEAIDLSNEFRINLYTHYFMLLKFEIYYMLDDLENAKKFYNFFQYTCELTKKIEYFNSVQDKLKAKYSLLFHNQV